MKQAALRKQMNLPAGSTDTDAAGYFRLTTAASRTEKPEGPTQTDNRRHRRPGPSALSTYTQQRGDQEKF